MTYWREASTLLLAAGGQEDAHFKVLMLKRTRSASFMPSSFVFPGGTLDAIDYSNNWNGLFKSITGYTMNDVNDQLKVSGIRPPLVTKERNWKLMSADVAFRICAIRETFEECGILLVTQKYQHLSDKRNAKFAIPHTVNPSLLHSWQHRVHQDSLQFLTLCQKLEVVPNVWALREWTCWLTPLLSNAQVASPKPNRFDTLFYICCIDCEQPPNAVIDNEEAVQSLWASPTELLTQTEVRAPQTYELGRLAHFHSLDSLATFCQYREPFGVERYFPVLYQCNDGIIVTYPGDCLYPSNPDCEGLKGLQAPLQQTIEELCGDNSRAMNRRVIHSKASRMSSDKIICNSPSVCGHKMPLNLSDIFVAEQKLTKL